MEEDDDGEEVNRTAARSLWESSSAWREISTHSERDDSASPADLMSRSVRRMGKASSSWSVFSRSVVVVAVGAVDAAIILGGLRRREKLWAWIAEWGIFRRNVFCVLCINN